MDFPQDQNAAAPAMPAIEVPEDNVSPEEIDRRMRLAASIQQAQAAQPVAQPVLDQSAINPLPAILPAVGIQPEAKVAEKVVEAEANNQAIQELAQKQQGLDQEVQAEMLHKQEIEQQRRAQELQADAAVHKEKAKILSVAKSQEEEAGKLQLANNAVEAKVQEYIPKTAGEMLQSGSFGQKLAAALGMLLGGYAGGLTGKLNNPFIETLDREVDNYAKKQNLSIAEKNAAREAAYKNQEMEIKSLMAKTDSQVAKAKLAELQQNLAAGQAAARQDSLKQLYLASGQIKDPSVFNDKEAERAVRLPDGSYKLAANKDLATSLNKFRDEVEPAIEGIKRVRAFAGNANRLSLEDRAKIGAEMQALVGQLRLSLVGPGALTDKEYERIQSTLGDPNAITAIKGVELKKLETVYNKLQKDLKSRFVRAGIDLPESRQDAMLKRLEEKGYDPEMARKALEKLRK